MQKAKRKFNTGESLAEVILSLALFAVIGTSVALLISGSFRGTLIGGTSTQALSYARETWEAVQSIGKTAYGQLQSGTYGLGHASGTWALIDTPDSNGVFTRTITIADTYRDSSGNISATGTKDVNTRKVTTKIAWNTGTNKNMSFVNYFTNWDSFDMSQIQGGFGQGIFATTKLTPLVVSTGTVPTSSVQLTTANSKFWKCALVQGVYNLTGTNPGLAIATYGNYAFMMDKGSNFSVFNKTDSKNPQLVISIDTGAGSINSATLTISNDGKYAYVGTSNSKFIAINITTPSIGSSIRVTSTLTIGGNSQAVNKIALYGTPSTASSFAYLATNEGNGGSAKNFYVVSLASSSNPSITSSVKLGTGPNSMGVVMSANGKYAFVINDDTSANSANVMVVSVATSTTPTLAKSMHASSTAVLKDVAIYITADLASSTLYVVSSNNAGSAGEFFEVDVSSSTKPFQSYSLNLGNGALSVTAEGNNALIGTMTANKNTLQVVDTAPMTTDDDGNDIAVVPAQPVIVLSINLSKWNYNSVFWDATDKLLYAATSDADAELQIVNRSGKINWGCMQKESVVKLFGSKTTGTGLSVFALNNYMYVGTHVMSRNPEFFIYNVSDPTSPQVPPGSAEIGASVNAIAVFGNFAFLGTDNTSKPLQVFDVSNPSAPSFVTSYDPGTSKTTSAVAVSSSTVLVAIGSPISTLYKLTTDGNGSLTPAGSLVLAGLANKIIFYAGYAYVSTNSNSQAVQIINYSNMTSPSSISLGSNGNGTGLWIKGKWLLVGSDNNNGNDFFAYDISGAGAPPNAPTSTIGALNLGAGVNSVSASPDENFAFAGIDLNGQEMRTVDLSGLLATTTPTFLAASSTETTLGGFINDMYFYNNNIFLATNAANNSGEAYIYGEIPGFAGYNTQYATNGTYMQNPPTDVWTYTVNKNVTWNSISWRIATSTGCGTSTSASIKMQVRSALDQTTLATLPFEGPDGSDSTFMTDSSGSFIYTPDNTATRYIQYLGTLVSDSSCTPYLTSVTYNATK